MRECRLARFGFCTAEAARSGRAPRLTDYEKAAPADCETAVRADCERGIRADCEKAVRTDCEKAVRADCEASALEWGRGIAPDTS